MRSMTGYGNGEAIENNSGAQLTVEISSVNRKQFELRFNSPRELSGWEIDLRKTLAGRISRGSVSVRLQLRYVNSSNLLQINESALTEVVNNARNLAQKLGLNSDLRLETLLQLPGMIGSPELSPDSEEVKGTFEQALAQALERFDRMRLTEGESLREDVLSRVAILESLLEELAILAQKLPDLAKQRLLDKFAQTDLDVELNEERLHRELLFYIDKSDINEEVTRLKSHFSQLHKFLAVSVSEPVGRSLDFLLQEMFREITTFGNKTGGVEISPLVVRFKSELEKIREQIQNIE